MELEGFVDGLVPMEEGLVLEAFLDGEERLRVGGLGGGGVRGGVLLLAGERFGVLGCGGVGFMFGGWMLVGEHFGAVGVGGAGFAGAFGAGHG